MTEKASERMQSENVKGKNSPFLPDGLGVNQAAGASSLQTARPHFSISLLLRLNPRHAASFSASCPEINTSSPSDFLTHTLAVHISVLTMPGFDFSNYNRNAALHARGVPLPKATSTGTTIVGCVYDKGVVVWL